MFTDTVSHRLSNGVEARADGLHMHIYIVCIVELWFRAKADLGLTDAGNNTYCWPWKEARNYLLDNPEDAEIVLLQDGVVSEWHLIPARSVRAYAEYDEVKRLNRIAAILVDGAKEFGILHWCLTTLGGRDD